MTAIMQKAFSAGELSPSLYARTDVAKYQTALRKCRNFYVMRHGGATNRPGTQYVGEVKDSSKEVRLIPFVFNTTQTYCLEFGNLYMRVIKNGEYIKLTSQAITGITNANPCVVTYSGSDTYANGDTVYISGIVGPIGTYLNGRQFKVANVNTGSNTFELDYNDGTNVNSTSFGAYTSGGTLEEIYEIATPYLEADLAQLKYVQSADVVNIVHPSYAPRRLARTGDASWTLTTITFEPEVDYPTSITAVQNGTTGSTTYKYTVTAFDPLTGQETPLKAVPPSGAYLATVANGNANLTATNSITVSWSLTSLYGYVAADLEFNIYREINGVYGFIGVSSGVTSFVDTGYDIDTTDTPPRIVEDFNAADDYPSTVTYYQQRLCLANTNNEIEKVWCSKTGNFYDFSTSQPIQDDDAVIFNLSGRQVNRVNHLVDLGVLIMFTESGEFVANGDQGGTLTPSAINSRQSSYNGSNSRLAPIVIGNSAIYVQSRGNNVRDINFKFESNDYTGDELSIYSAHLVDDFQLVDWAYQQIPHSILWMVRDDGTMLGMTYVREQQMLAWHQHDFENGFVESVCSIPEGSEDTLYMTVLRIIDGKEVRYIEKFVSRKISDIKDIAILDSHLSYDGRNTGSTTMTLSGSGWAYTDTLTLTASASTFVSTDVGNEIQIYDTDGTVIRFEITAYTSATVVSGRPNRTVPVTLQAVATSNWARAVDTISGLWHLEGQSVSVYADGLVVGNPNNDAYEEIMVSNGQITLSENYAVIYVGLPITSDIETLNIDTPSANTMIDRNKLISKVSLYVEKTRGLWAGTRPPDETVDFLDGLTELKIREGEPYDSPVDLETDPVDIITEATWNNNGRVFIRQTDPVPCSILSIAPTGYIPFPGGS
jgi:hypothetical protein